MSETGNEGFEVQRQKERGWAQVGYVESKAFGGTTTKTQSYEYVATGLSVGPHQFRLRQVDLDGSSSLTDPVTVDIQMQETVSLAPPAPNPGSATATLSFAVKKQTETIITLYNTLGQQVATVYEGTPQAEEAQTAQVDVSGLPGGTYFLRLRADGQT
ncbi:MAG: T9SS type A sorting domain-containing protein [Salinibacter sp.]|uniref:T9SS type A sorting domain-containing protein n=1 Tax=Salinibacter sp. TaxID=2065818 RepID=UPI0035D4DCBD